jgi:hypothetical protein
MGHKGPVLRCRCIGPGRVRTQIPFSHLFIQMLPLFLWFEILYTVWWIEYGLNSQGIVVRFLSGWGISLFSRHRDQLWIPSSIQLHVFRGLLPLGRIEHCVMPTANLCQLLRLRMIGAVPPLPSLPAWHAQGQVFVYIFQRSALGITQFSVAAQLFMWLCGKWVILVYMFVLLLSFLARTKP